MSNHEIGIECDDDDIQQDILKISLMKIIQHGS